MDLFQYPCHLVSIFTSFLMHKLLIDEGNVCVKIVVPIIYIVHRLRDGKSFATRRVDALQKGNIIFTLLASFQVCNNCANIFFFLVWWVGLSCSHMHDSLMQFVMFLSTRDNFSFLNACNFELFLQKEEAGFEHQEAMMPPVPAPDMVN